MTHWRQHLLDVLFVAAEVVAWFMALRVVATAMEQTFLYDVAVRLETSIASRGVSDIGRAESALVTVRRAMDASHGPSIFLVLATALGAFWLMRALMRYRFEGPAGAALFLAGSVLALNVVLHIAIAGDLRIWDTSGLAGFMSNPESSFAGRLDLEAFIRQPDVSRAHGTAMAFVFMSMIGMWLRFAVAGRSRVTFDRVLRSFTIGFIVTLIAVVFAYAIGQPLLTIFAVPQFMLGMLALAVANHARGAAASDDTIERSGPWAVAVGGTIALLTGVALLLGLLALLNVGAVLAAIGNVAAAILGFLLIVIMTPIFWVLERILRLIVPQALDRILSNLDRLQTPERPELETSDALGLPMWIENGFKFLAVIFLIWLTYRIALIIMARRRAVLAAAEEARGSATGRAATFGELLRGLLPGRARGLIGDWTRRQAIYRLYGRAVAAADTRGFRYLHGETPLEFSTRAARAMDGAPYPPIGEAFDRARYGRHYPSEDEVREMASALAAWETATPPTPELRERLAGAAPLTEAQEFELMLAERREEQRARSRRGRGSEPPQPPPQML